MPIFWIICWIVSLIIVGLIVRHKIHSSIKQYRQNLNDRKTELYRSVFQYHEEIDDDARNCCNKSHTFRCASIHRLENSIESIEVMMCHLDIQLW